MGRVIRRADEARRVCGGGAAYVCVCVCGQGACLRGAVQQLRVYELLVVGQFHRQAVLVHLRRYEIRDKR